VNDTFLIKIKSAACVMITFGKRKNLLYLHCAYETGEEVYDEKYHASGLINLIKDG